MSSPNKLFTQFPRQRDHSLKKLTTENKLVLPNLFKSKQNNLQESIKKVNDQKKHLFKNFMNILQQEEKTRRKNKSGRFRIFKKKPALYKKAKAVLGKAPIGFIIFVGMESAKRITRKPFQTPSR